MGGPVCDPVRSTTTKPNTDLRHIARLLQAPFSTVARALRRPGLGGLRNLERQPPVQRYEWDRPGDLIRIDIKSLAQFRKVGYRITGYRQQGCSYGVGYDIASRSTTPYARPTSRSW